MLDTATDQDTFAPRRLLDLTGEVEDGLDRIEATLAAGDAPAPTSGRGS